MKKTLLIEVATLIKRFETGSTSYYVGGGDALRLLLERHGYTCSYQGLRLVIHDWNGHEVVRV